MLLHCNNYAITLQKHSFYNAIYKCLKIKYLHIALQSIRPLSENGGQGVLRNVNFAVLKP